MTPIGRTPLRLLALDPSSTRTGYAWAVLTDTLRPKATWGFTGVGAILPDRTKDPALVRIDAMCKKIFDMVMGIQADKEMDLTIVIEVTSGKVNSMRHGGGGAGLATYGMAIGAIRETCRQIKRIGDFNVDLHSISENKWTGGHSKAKRNAVARKHCPLYTEAIQKKDRGGDVSDAIALAVWYMQIGSKI